MGGGESALPPVEASTPLMAVVTDHEDVRERELAEAA
jgi:hypothetical protein